MSEVNKKELVDLTIAAEIWKIIKFNPFQSPGVTFLGNMIKRYLDDNEVKTIIVNTLVYTNQYKADADVAETRAKIKIEVVNLMACLITGRALLALSNATIIGSAACIAITCLIEILFGSVGHSVTNPIAAVFWAFVFIAFASCAASAYLFFVTRSKVRCIVKDFIRLSATFATHKEYFDRGWMS